MPTLPRTDREPRRQRIYLDFTHLGRHVTGIERVTIEQFEKVHFAGADVRPVRARGVVAMILRQQFLIPLLALLHPGALFVFPGFPPSPLMRLARGRAVMYVHDLFLLNRRQDLGTKARLYMAWPFAVAVRGLKYFLTNSAKTRSELEVVAPEDARIGLYRPRVGNVFGLAPSHNAPATAASPDSLRILALGTIEPRKNYSAAAAIVAALRRKGFPGARIEIVGREGWGNETDKLRSDPCVALRGYLPTAAAKAAIEAADLYLCTSHDEGLGLPLVEVQYAGLAVVAPDAPVFREVLGASGTFIDPSDPEAAADAIVRLVAAPDWRVRMRELALANVARWNAAAEADARTVSRLFVAPLDRAWPARITAASAR
jgi:glycosyltransferase involved in cell wall biosynthesis